MKITGNTILITGGSSGIGAALAHRLHDLDNEVVVTGRDQKRLEATVKGREHLHAVLLDIDDPEAIDAVAAQSIRRFPALNVLVNNAGIMRKEAIDGDRDLTDAEAIIKTNLLGPIRMTNALVDHLKSVNDAAIVNVSSGLGFVPLPTTPTYSASKAAIHSYTVSLRSALKGRVEVIELVPPAVQTELLPGQSTRGDAMPLDAFMEEVMQLFQKRPTPAEILVDRVGFLRRAEIERRFDAALATLVRAQH